MNDSGLIISRGILQKDCLKGNIAIVTGAGRGIGLETARSLAWLGCTVIIAEIDRTTGLNSEISINCQIGKDSAYFVNVDLASEKSIKNFSSRIMKTFGRADIIINNATVVTVGTIQDVSLEDWDRTYRVNLKAPVTLIREFLPGMIKRNRGTIICVSSSGAAAYMGAYEVFKTAQAELATTLSLELEGSGVNAFTIGPGLVRTPGAIAGISKIAPLMGQTVDEFFEIGKDWMISAEAAGAGFAAAAAMADRFRGQEISSRAALIEAGIDTDEVDKDKALNIEKGLAVSSHYTGISDSTQSSAKDVIYLCSNVKNTLSSVYDSWKPMNNFMKQWVLRDFKKQTGLSIEEAISNMEELHRALSQADMAAFARLRMLPSKLFSYYNNYYKQASGFIKDPELRKQQTDMISGWKKEVENLLNALEKI